MDLQYMIKLSTISNKFIEGGGVCDLFYIMYLFN